jgi:hypothetical protein
MSGINSDSIAMYKLTSELRIDEFWVQGQLFSSDQWPMSSERDSFAKGIFSTFAKGFLLHKLLLKVNYSPLRVKKIPLT